jgi:hypothetical protein
MTARHTVSRADELFAGNVSYLPYSPDGRAGVKLDTLKFVDLGVPVTADAAAIVNDATTFTNSTVTLTAGSLLLTTLDVPRNLQVVAAATTLTQVVTVTGTDEYGEAMTESLTLNGTTPVLGGKAFKGVSQVVIQPGAAGSTVDVGHGTNLGLPFRIARSVDVVGGLYADNVVNTTAVFVTGLATTVTSTAGTGDVRGTVVSTGSLPNGARRYTLLMSLPNISDKEVVFGVDQA